ncbi:MAG: hypothetical protein WCO52_06190 [bacterium]
MAKNFFDLPAVRQVSAWVICHEGDCVGKILVAYPKDGAGIVRAFVTIWSGPLQQDGRMTGKAKGYGWDKTSGAVDDALGNLTNGLDLSGRGMGAITSFFESHGYSLWSVI